MERVIKETIEWEKVEVQEQKKIARNEPVRLTVKDITDKMALLDREVKYLVNKLKLWRPKVKPTPPPKVEKNTSKEEDEQNTEEVVAEEEQVIEETPNQSEGEATPSSEDGEEIKPSKTEEPSDEDQHTEL